MFDFCPCTLGLGVMLAWAALPVLVWLARRGSAGGPGAYYRSLVWALVIAAGMSTLPALRSATDGVFMDLRVWHGSSFAFDSLRLALAWFEPFVGQTALEWPDSPVGRGLSFMAKVYAPLVAFGVLRFSYARARVARVCRRATPAPARVMALAEELARALGIAVPRVVVSPATNVPFTAGVFSPVVVLPESLLGRASSEQLTFVIHHELLHVARGDLRASLVIGLVRQLFVFHPTASPLLAEISLAREASVDERVGATAPLEYAKFLVELAEHVRQCRPLLAASLPMADTALTRRITMIIEPVRPARCPVAGRRTMALLFASAFAVVGSVLFAPQCIEARKPPSSPCPRTAARPSSDRDPPFVAVRSSIDT